MRYQSDETYSKAVFKFYFFGFVASCFMHIPLGIAGVAFHAPAISMMLVMAVVQVMTWLIVANAMCLALQSFMQLADKNKRTPPTPPREKVKTTEFEGKNDIMSITRVEKYQ